MTESRILRLLRSGDKELFNLAMHVILQTFTPDEIKRIIPPIDESKFPVPFDYSVYYEKEWIGILCIDGKMWTKPAWLVNIGFKEAYKIDNNGQAIGYAAVRRSRNGIPSSENNAGDVYSR